MTDNSVILAKIKQVVAAGEQLREEQFRVILEGLVKKGGRDAEMLLIQYMTSDKIEADTREYIIRCTGYILSNVFLVPLKKIIDSEPRLPLKNAAVIALAKFNNQRALNILNASLQSIQNPYLLKTIKEQISMVKKNNPILSLLPRFLNGDGDQKAFMTVMGILRNILKPEGTTIFANYLRHEDLSIRCGSFELLCHNGDSSHQQQIFEFFYQRLHPDPNKPDGKLPPAEETESLFLAKHVKIFFLRFTNLILTQIRRLNGLYQYTTDEQIKKLIISIYCHSTSNRTLTFIKGIYDAGDPELREFIIEESAGNEKAVEFLFENYQAGQQLKEKVVKALLSSRKGFEYFSTRFSEFDEKAQEVIVKSLPNEIKPRMIAFIKTLFCSDLTHLKVQLLKRIRDNFLLNFKDILFAPERQKELFSVERDYLATISLLFPISTLKLLLEEVAGEDPEVGKMKRFMEKVIEITNNDIAIIMKDQTLFEMLVLKIINACSLELNEMLLKVLEKIKTLDRSTYKSLYDAFNLFTIQRGQNLVEEESYSMKRVNDNFKNIIEDIKKADTLEKEVKMILAKSVPDLNQLKRVIETYHLGAAPRIKHLTQLFAKHIMALDEKEISYWREFLKGFPILTQLIREEQFKLSKPDAAQRESIQEKLRIIIRFEEKYLTALFKDQLNQLIPHFRVVTDAISLENTDILLCDSQALKDYINRNVLTTKRIFVLLDGRSEFNTFKALNPKSFLRPISVYRVVKLILQELYLTR